MAHPLRRALAGALLCPCRRDLPKAGYQTLDTGHFVLKDQFDVAEPLIRDFINRKLGRK